MGINNKYYRNRIVKYKHFTLSITTGLTVYNVTNRGFVKLDSYLNKTIGVLCVALPNKETISIGSTEKGLQVVELIKKGVVNE
jgi:hypothetical protein